jgi:thioesterase domain-containing protein
VANTNHAGTAFAGSLNAIATLSGWATVWLLLREREIAAQVVIQDSTVRYLRPVTGDFEAVCTPPSEEAIAHLVTAVTRRGKGRIELAIAVRDHQGDAVQFRGRYVAIQDRAR